MPTKKRADRNRTLLLTGEDYERLPRYLSSPDRPVTPEEILDTTIRQDLMEAVRFLPEEFADLIVVDPPYNLTKDFNGLTHRAADDASYMAYVESWLPAVMKRLKPTGSIYICCDWRSSTVIYRVLDRYAYIRNRITWQREKGRGARANWKNSMEDIWFATADDKEYYFDIDAVMQKKRVIAPYRVNHRPKGWVETSEGNYRLTYPSNFWDDISVPFWSMPENTDHPTQKPEKLIAKLILASCPAGGMVFDPFLGSGTTSVVAKKLGRHYCGVEINEEYALLAVKRLLRAEDNREIQGYTGGVFWDRNSLREQKRYQAADNPPLSRVASRCTEPDKAYTHSPLEREV